MALLELRLGGGRMKLKDVQDALNAGTVLIIEAVIYDRYPELVQPYLDTVDAARLVANPNIEANRSPFPVLGRTSFLESIPWYVAEMVYLSYHRQYPGQSLKRIAERGGFGAEEVVKYLLVSIENGDVLLAALTPGDTDAH
jgi:hypothetical protein